MEKLTLTPAVLFEEELVKKILDNMISELGISEPNWQELFGVTNVQKNELEDRHYEEALSLHLQENYIAGFQTAESQLQSLKESSHDKFFTVWTAEDVKNFTQTQRKKFFLLYGLFLKNTQIGNKQLTFFEYMDKFLVESQVNARTQLGLEVGLKFSLSILKEVRKLSQDMLVSSLSYLYQALADTTP